MSDKDDASGPKEEALRLKNLAEEKYNSGDLNSAVAYAERARDLHPAVSGLRQMLTAFQILRAAAAYPLPDGGAEKQRPTPDYYKILQVQRFSHINSIKKQYKKLALTLHPDKNPFVASEEAFKLVGEAARVLSDKIRRKEYDLRLRIAMQSAAVGAVAVEIGEEGSRETFWTACSACQLLHQFERKFLGHNLICPRCKKTFKAMEVEERSNEDEGKNEKNEANTRVSARIQERVAKGGYVGSVERFGLGAKRRNSTQGEVSERLVAKMARTSASRERVDKSGEGDAVENGRFKEMETLVNGGEEALGSGEVEIVGNQASKGVDGRVEESMTLSQMQMLVKKKKKKRRVVGGKLSMKAKGVNAKKLKVNGMMEETEKDGERECGEENLSDDEDVDEMEDVRGEERAKEREEGAGKEKVVNLRGNSNRRRVPKVRNLEAVHAASRSRILLDFENERSLDKGNSEVLPVEKEKGKEKEKEKENEMDITREKKGRRRVTRSGNSDISNIKSSNDLEAVHATSSNHLHSENEQDRSLEKGNSEVLPVEKEKEKEIDITGEKKGRHRVTRSGNSDISNTKSSKDLEAVLASPSNHLHSENERDRSLEKGNSEVLPVEKEKEKEKEKENEMDITREMQGRRRVTRSGNSNISNAKSSKDLEAVCATSSNHLHSESEQDRSLEKGNSDVLLVEKEKEVGVTKEKKGKRRVPKNSGKLNTESSKNLEAVQAASRNHINLEIGNDRTSERGDSEVLLEQEQEQEKEKEKEKEMDVTREKKGRRRVPKNSSKLNTESSKNLEAVQAASRNHINLEVGNDRTSERGDFEVLPLEQEKEKEKEKEMDVTREKKGRRRVPKNSATVNRNSSKNHVDSDIQRLIANKKGDLEIMAVEESDFHDFDKDRRERRFKKGQVWAVYDDVDAMPRHYALINEIVSVNPFEVTVSRLQPQNNEDDELISRREKGFNISCGIFQVTRKVTIRYLNLFSHLVDCERAARVLYRIYPKKGSVWAVYSSSGREGEERDDNRCYNVVICLSSYSDIHGLSIAYLEKVEGFRTVFKRKEIGANAVVCLGVKDIKIFSHQIPAKKLSGEESSGLPKDCWELDPASLTPQLLTES